MGKELATLAVVALLMFAAGWFTGDRTRRSSDLLEFATAPRETTRVENTARLDSITAELTTAKARLAATRVDRERYQGRWREALAFYQALRESLATSAEPEIPTAELDSTVGTSVVLRRTGKPDTTLATSIRLQTRYLFPPVGEFRNTRATLPPLAIPLEQMTVETRVVEFKTDWKLTGAAAVVAGAVGYLIGKGN